MRLNHSLIKHWLTISITTFLISYLMWSIMDYENLVRLKINYWNIFFDISYCAIYTIFSLMVSNTLGRILIEDKINHLRFSIHVVVLLIANLTWAISFENLFKTFWNEDNDVYWDRLYIFTLAGTLLTMTNACMYYCRIIIKKEKENIQLNNNLLRTQANPHFIFNSINTLVDLIQTDSIAAEKFTLKLSEIYRYIVNHLDKNIVSINQEISFVKSYCQLLNLSSPCTINLEINDELERSKGKILALSVQMMVENAIKHNRHTKEEPLTIYINKLDKYIVIKNKLNPIKSSLPTTRKGLANLSKRYKQLGKEITINKDPKFFEVKLPII